MIDNWPPVDIFLVYVFESTNLFVGAKFMSFINMPSRCSLSKERILIHWILQIRLQICDQLPKKPLDINFHRNPFIRSKVIITFILFFRLFKTQFSPSTRQQTEFDDVIYYLK